MIQWQLLPSLLGGNVKPPEAKEYIPPDKRPTGGGLGSIFSMLPHVVAGMQGGNLGGEAKHVLKGVMSGDFNRALPFLAGVLPAVQGLFGGGNRGGMAIGGLGGGFLAPGGFEGIAQMPSISNQIPFSPSGGITGMMPNFLSSMPFGGGMFGGRNSMMIGGNVDDRYQQIQDKQDKYL